jgi:hypothetical protein
MPPRWTLAPAVSPTAAAMLALRGLAQRYQHLDTEITQLTGTLD